MSMLPENKKKWTITDEKGGPVLAFSSFIDFELHDAGTTLSAPAEEGGFASYNKVESAKEARLSLGMQGSDDTLQAALEAIENLKKQTRLINIVTPSQEYASLTVESYTYKRSRENGINTLFVSLSLKEVREVSRYNSALNGGKLSRGKVKNPEQATALLLGKVQGIAASIRELL